MMLAVGLMTVTAMNAQDRALGFRFGGGIDLGGEISYQQYLSDQNRLEADLGFFSNSGIAVTGIYQWVWALDELGDGFAWYAGVGAGLRLHEDGMGAGINGQLGIEYSLPSAPLQFSLDTRPGWYFGSSNPGDFGLALSIRYLF